MSYWKESKLELEQAKAVYKAITTEYSNDVAIEAVSESFGEFEEFYLSVVNAGDVGCVRNVLRIASAAKKYIDSIEATISENVGENDPYKDCSAFNQ